MEERDIGTLADILSNDRILVQNWPRLYSKLGLPSAEEEILRQRHIFGIKGTFGLFCHILQSWKCLNGRAASLSKLQAILEALHYKSVAEEIKRTFRLPRFRGLDLEIERLAGPQMSIPFSPLSRIKHNYEKPVAGYVERIPMEKYIINYLLTTSNVKFQMGFPIIVLHGIGGNGKTTLARRIIQICEKKKHFGENSIFINAENSITTKKEFCDVLALPNHNISDTDVKSKLMEHVYRSIPCLIVFDNVDDYKMLLGYLPLNVETSVKILVTSNYKWLSNDFGKVENLAVDKFTETEYSEFVRNNIPGASDSDIDTLAEYTGRIPYLTNIVCSEYNNLHGRTREEGIQIHLLLGDQEILSDERTATRNFLLYQKSQTSIVERQINSIIKTNHEADGVAAFRIMSILAYCNCEIAKEDFFSVVDEMVSFKSFAQNCGRKNVKEVGLRILLENQVVTENHLYGRRRISVHRSHQDAIRKILRRREIEQDQIQEIVKAELSKNCLYRNSFNFSTLWETGKVYKPKMLESMISSSPFLCGLIHTDVKDGVKSVFDYARQSKSNHGFIRWLLTPIHENVEIPFVQAVRKGYFEMAWNGNFSEFLYDVKDFCKYHIKEVNETETTLILCVLESLDLKCSQWIDQTLVDFPHLLNPNQNQVFFMAVKKGKLDIVKHLIANKRVDLNGRDNNGNTALHWASIKSQVEVTEELLTNDAELNTQDIFGYTPLHSAIIGNAVQIAKKLLSFGADPNIQSKIGWTPLFWAVFNKRVDCVKCLISYSTVVLNLNIRDADNRTVWDIVEERKNVEILELFTELGYKKNKVLK